MKKIVLVVSIMLSISTLLTLKSQNAIVAETKIINLTETNFDASIKKGLILVDFYADWCRPCKLMRPVLEEFAGEYSTKIKVAAVNTDYNKNLSTKYQVSGIPCLILFKDGKEVKRLVGYREKQSLISELSQWLN